MRLSKRRRSVGFTLVEILVVVTILGIAAVIAVPMLGSTDEMRAESAARELASMLLLAQTSAISTQEEHQVVFDAGGTWYEVRDSAGAVIADPYVSGRPCRVDYGTERRQATVRIGSASFDGAGQVWFDRMGSPYGGAVVTNPAPLTSGQVVVRAGEATVGVTVEPITGQIRIN